MSDTLLLPTEQLAEKILNVMGLSLDMPVMDIQLQIDKNTANVVLTIALSNAQVKELLK